VEGEGLDTFVPVLELLDRRRIELFCYADGRLNAPLAVRARQRANSWFDLDGVDDATAALVIANDDLDVLIELDGPTRCTRPALFAGRPSALALAAYGVAEVAPALGFDGSIGPQSAWSTEVADRIVGIPGGIAALPTNLLPIRHEPRESGPTVFGTLAQRWQIGAETAAAWAAILAALPEATLVLNLERLGGLEAAHDLALRFGAILPQDRVLSIGRGDTLTDYLRAIDILLDPIDNPHPDEALAALALGMPVLTCRSAVPRASMLAAWLEAAGLEELVAADRAAYEAAAARYGEPPARRALAERVGIVADAELTEGPARQAARLGAALEAAVSRLGR
jgi:predicted O-linked N-acetylglucosamine transferase (SPINDLY family)